MSGPGSSPPRVAFMRQLPVPWWASHSLPLPDHLRDHCHQVATQSARARLVRALYGITGRAWVVPTPGWQLEFPSFPVTESCKYMYIYVCVYIFFYFLFLFFFYLKAF